MAARLTKRLATQTRDGIQTSMILRRVQAHALGTLEMTVTQLRAAEILLRKTLPDLQSITHDGTINMGDARTLTHEQLMHIAAGSSAGTTDAGGGIADDAAIH